MADYRDEKTVIVDRDAGADRSSPVGWIILLVVLLLVVAFLLMGGMDMLSGGTSGGADTLNGGTNTPMDTVDPVPDPATSGDTNPAPGQ